MVVKLGRYGRFLSCSKFPDCKGMRSIDGKTDEDIQKEASSEDFLLKYKPAPQTEDGRNYLLKDGRYGRFWAHPDYPKVKDAKPLDLTRDIFEKVYGKAPKSKDQVCSIYPLDPYMVPRPPYDRAKGGSVAGGKRNGSRVSTNRELQKDE